MGNIKLYLLFFKTYLKVKSEYRVSFFMDLFSQFSTFAITYLSIWILFGRFKDINGWNFYEVVFLYNINLFSYGLAGLFFFNPLRFLEEMIHSGEFDCLMHKPMSVFMHLICRRFNQSYLGYLILGIIVFRFCMDKLNIIWTVANVIWFIIVMTGAFLIQASIIIISGTTGFWLTRSASVTETIVHRFRSFITYPVSIYNTFVQILLTFVIPYAFVNYYPGIYFLDREDSSLFSPYFQYLTPVVGIVLMILAMGFWRIGMNRYQSTGS